MCTKIAADVKSDPLVNDMNLHITFYTFWRTFSHLGCPHKRWRTGPSQSSPSSMEDHTCLVIGNCGPWPWWNCGDRNIWVFYFGNGDSYMKEMTRHDYRSWHELTIWHIYINYLVSTVAHQPYWPAPAATDPKKKNISCAHGRAIETFLIRLERPPGEGQHGDVNPNFTNVLQQCVRLECTSVTRSTFTRGLLSLSASTMFLQHQHRYPTIRPGWTMGRQW